MFLTFFIKTVSAFFCFIWNNILSRKTRKSDWCFFLHFLCFFFAYFFKSHSING